MTDARSSAGGAREWQVGLCVAMAAVIAYAAALTGQFVYDDLHSVSGNLAVHSLANVPSYFWDPGAFSASGAQMYRPVLLSTFAVDWALGGGSPVSFKLTLGDKSDAPSSTSPSYISKSRIFI